MLYMYDKRLTMLRVIARISIDVTTPPPERKFDGVFQIVTEFSPMASPAFEVGRYALPVSEIASGVPNSVTLVPPTPKLSSRAYLRKPSVARTHLTPNRSASLLA
jgi:hypothetical protein